MEMGREVTMASSGNLGSALHGALTIKNRKTLYYTGLSLAGSLTESYDI